MLNYEEARKFYDAFGEKQDKQFYEASAINLLLEFGEFDRAKNVVEFGCGTGKFASRLLNESLTAECKYLGVDISQNMIRLCQEKITPYADHADCYKSDGGAEIDLPGQSVDRFVSLYVLDLLSEEDVTCLIMEARRVLECGGYLCVVSLTHGETFISRVVEFIWCRLHTINPVIVGGCLPIKLQPFLDDEKWEIVHDTTLESFGVASEVVVAKKI